MAKAIITLSDNEDGTLGVVLEYDPPVQRDDAGTIAQRVAMSIVEEITENAEEITHMSITGSKGEN